MGPAPLTHRAIVVQPDQRQLVRAALEQSPQSPHRSGHAKLHECQGHLTLANHFASEKQAQQLWLDEVPPESREYACCVSFVNEQVRSGSWLCWNRTYPRGL